LDDLNTPVDNAIETTMNDQQGHSSDTITSLSHLPSWLSMPALPVQRQPQALMAIDLNSRRDFSPDRGGQNEAGYFPDEKERRARMRVKSHQRIRSYQQILEDFREQAGPSNGQKQGQRLEGGETDQGDEEDDIFGGNEQDEEDDNVNMDLYYTPSHSTTASPLSSPVKQRREDTARRSKRFSLPAVALHATNVTARTTEVGADIPAIPQDGRTPSGSGDVPSPARSKRFSLVLAGRNSHYSDGVPGGSASGPNSAGVSKNASEDAAGDMGLAKGVAAAKLTELLKKANSQAS